MFQGYAYEKPAFIGKKNTDALTAAFAGGGWLHLNDNYSEDRKIEPMLTSRTKEELH